MPGRQYEQINDRSCKKQTNDNVYLIYKRKIIICHADLESFRPMRAMREKQEKKTGRERIQ